jgi:four helix bundle protein
MIQGKQNYDLEERTASFGETIIKFCRELPKSYLTQPLLVQLIRCGTSIGANYCEADNAESRKDFTHKIGICKKESNHEWIVRFEDGLDWLFESEFDKLSETENILLNETKELGWSL